MIIICPGFHPPQATAEFITAMGWQTSNTDFLIIPPKILPYDFRAIAQWLWQQVSLQTPLFFLGFSAGVVGALGAAIAWQQRGGIVKGLIAIDGWGVPTPLGGFPIYRVSHDAFTHYTSQLLGKGKENFYCSPPVSHLALWQRPDLAWGWWEIKLGCQVRCSAATMIKEILNCHRITKENKKET